MFSGIITEVGTLIESIPTDHTRHAFRLTIASRFEDLRIGDSIAIQGICLTVTKIEGRTFTVEATEGTVKKTTLSYWHPSQRLNLERALQVSDRLDGHVVQGHVNTIAQITHMKRHTESTYIEYQMPHTFARYVVCEGSIAIDGVSLTVAHLADPPQTPENRDDLSCTIGINLIPYTIQHTALGLQNLGDYVNIEVDIVGRYVERLLSLYGKIS